MGIPQDNQWGLLKEINGDYLRKSTGTLKEINRYCIIISRGIPSGNQLEFLNDTNVDSLRKSIGSLEEVNWN